MMILSALFLFILPIRLVFFFRDAVDEWRNPTPRPEQADSGGSTFGLLDGGGDSGCDGGGCGCH